MSQTVKPRRISEFLPEVLQTDLIKKFFAATADHMFQPERVEYVNAYVGSLPDTYNANKDARITEQDKTRRDYQLQPAAVSRLPLSDSMTHMMVYDDLIQKLRWQGALVNDHNRLFSAEYYSFGLPVDWDKLINYSEYVWLPQGPRLIKLLDSTNISQIQLGATYTYSGRWQLDGETLERTDVLPFTSGLRVQFTQDIQVNVRTDVLIVEGVGTQIRFVKDNVIGTLGWDSPSEWDSTVWDGGSVFDTPAYVNLGRGSVNQNPWSVGNRWFHKQVITLSETVLENINSQSAQRPILEFAYDCTLRDFGTQFLNTVNMVDSTTRNLDEIQGKSDQTVDGVPVDDDQIILFTNLRSVNNVNELDPVLNNRLYKVSNVRAENKVVLTLLPRDQDASGTPVKGDVIWVLQGVPSSNPDSTNINTHWYYTGSQWRKGQSRQILPDADPTSVSYKQIINKSPLFELYDHTGTNLGDPATYPGSNFAGSTLIQYKQNAAQPVDPVLGLRVDYADESARNYIFEVTSAGVQVQYSQNNVQQLIPGYYYWQQQTAHMETYYNNWFKCSEPSRQYVVNEYVATDAQQSFQIDQAPAPQLAAIDNITVRVGSKDLNSDEYVVQDLKVTLKTAANAGDVVRIRTWAGLHNQATQGYFETPVNLRVNPNNLPVTEFSLAQVLAHAHSVLKNQAGFVGSVSGSNNWRDLAQDQGLGHHILQHRAPMLKLMILNVINQTDVFEGSQSVTDPMQAMQWAQSEYLKFYNKFVNSLFNLYNNQAVTLDTAPAEWIQRALKQVNLGKTKTSAWTNSGIDMQMGAYCGSQSVNPTWVPPTAARLGAAPVYQPVVFVDVTQPVNPDTQQYPLSLRCHNGAILVLKDADNQNLGEIISGSASTSAVTDLSHPIARAWLLFELLQYDSLPEKYKSVNHVPDLDPRTIWSGKFRQTSYSRADWLKISSVAWQRWLTFNQLDAFRNTSFDVTDPFTWNYGTCVDQDQQPVPGHYRGMYFYYYDTDRPDQAPWEMLGFSQQPEWWTAEYGAAPYTRGNTKLWQDLTDGTIRQGARQGVHAAWARPQLLKYIPVNDAGELLAPFDAGIITQLPTYTQAAAEWRFGDRSPLENVWLTTADADFLWAEWAYLANPACFVEYLWDNTRQIPLFANQPNSQWVYSDTFTRKSMSQFIMHREDPSTLNVLPVSTATYYGSCGIQHWISEKLVSESRSVTQFLGTRIRGTTVNLTHRMGGFTDGDNLRVLVDSFGLTNTENLLLPQEDVVCQLMRSASTAEYVYTGVIVEYQGRNAGWRVLGYDAVNPFFTVIPSDPKGAKQTVVVDNQTVIEYKQGLKTTAQVAYGTIFETRQQVYDFLISLGRAQTTQGWQFDQYDSTAGRPRDWSLSAREFLFWSQGPWAAGTYIALSPLATLAKFQTEFGTIQNVGDQVNGAYSVLDRSGQIIRMSNMDFLRMEDEISVKPLNDQGIYALRLYTTSLEHVLIFNNRTVFGDLIYDPVFDQAQSRFKLFGYRSLDWQGRLSAPGYLVTQTVDDSTGVLRVRNQIVPNLEKSVNDLRKVFEIDLATPYQVGNTSQVSTISQTVPRTMSRLAQHNTGYQPRPYLTDLLLDNSAEFQFYLGMIKQKGTSSVLDALLRNTQVLQPEEQFSYFEEWAFRSGTYGYEQDVNYLDVILVKEQVSGNPQLVELLSDLTEDATTDDKIVIVKNDSRIVNFSGARNKFKLRTYYGPALGDLPTAGYVLPSEVNYQVVTRDDLRNLYSLTLARVAADPANFTTLQAGDVIWQIVDVLRGWNVWKVYESTWKIVQTIPNTVDSNYTTVTVDQPHNLQEGDLLVIYGVVNAGVNISGTFQVINVLTETQFDIDVRTTSTGTGGTCLTFFSMRFANLAQRDQAQPPLSWQRGDLVYVDGTSSTPWNVYISSGRTWFVERVETLKTDPQYLQGSRLYDLDSLQTLTYLTIWDPVKNKIPGVLDQEIAYKTPYDPAQYTQDPSGIYGTNVPDAWGSDQVGVVWWDLSTTRFIDYELGTDNYRRQNWGKIQPGTSIDIYEWVRSPVPPASWATLVRTGTDLSGIGSAGPASGQVRSDQAPYAQRVQYNSAGQPQTVYYFWVRNSVQVPDVEFRKLSATQIASALESPDNLGISWWAAVSDVSTLVANVGPYLNGSQTVWQTQWLDKLDLQNDHAQYDLVRPSDPRSAPPVWLWDKLQDSVLAYNPVGDLVPNLRLKPLQIEGTSVRPSQTLFLQSAAVRRALVNTVNDWLANNPVPPTRDSERQGWRPFFQSEEPEPAPTNTQMPVVVATTPYDVLDATSGRLNAYYVIDDVTGRQALRGTQPQVLQIDGVFVQSAQRVLVKNQQDPTSAVNPVSTEQPLSAQNGIYEVIDAGSLLITTNLAGTWDAGNQELEALAPSTLVLESRTLTQGEKVFLSAQSDSTESGLFVVKNAGSVSERWVLSRLYDLDACVQNTSLTTWLLVRVPELSESGYIWAQAQVSVTQGVTQASTVWNQTNPYVLQLGESKIVWQQAPAPALYSQRVNNMAELESLSYSVPFGSRVLVASDPSNQNKWTIWSWQAQGDGTGVWQLFRSQSYRTPNMWSYVDWYAPGYDSTQLPSIVYDDLRQRDQDLNVTINTLVKVLNTGAGTWAWYVKIDLENQPWLLVAEQQSGLQLSDALWDYETYQMGFGVNGFGSEILGAEYDSRLELEQIFKGLWRAERSTGGLLKITNQINEPNEMLFVCVRKIFETQKFVDWAFKTSFINLRGFAEQLVPSTQYTTNKINSLIQYVNEVKPYHVKIRQFVDWRTAQDEYTSASVDFDKPPYQERDQTARILDVQSASDQVILNTNDRYTAWYRNYLLYPSLIRNLKTRIKFDRVSCDTTWTYEYPYNSSSVPDITCVSLAEWFNTITSALDTLTLVEVRIPEPSVLIRNTQLGTGIAVWNVVTWGLNYAGTIDQTIYTVDDLQVLLQTVYAPGHAVKVFITDWVVRNWFVKQGTNTASLDDWHTVAFENDSGAAYRIQHFLNETDVSGLISGCETRLLTLDGAAYETSDSWDQNTWDNVRGWDYTQKDDIYDVNVQSGQSPRYQVFVGDGVKQSFVLNGAPQAPNDLNVFVNGIQLQTPTHWVIRNQISQFLVSVPGINYQVNDVIQLSGGVCDAPAKLKVLQVNNQGGILKLSMLEPGAWSKVPDQNPVSVQGGSGILATVQVRWQGDHIDFVQAPSVPTQNKPNIWILEKGASFLPVLQGILETTFDGAGLNRPHLEAGHPEELMMTWSRQNVSLDVYTAGTSGSAPMWHQTYLSDGVNSHFALDGVILQNDQLWVWVNGVLQTWGVNADYVINYEQNMLVFVNPPASGLISVIQVGWGGASQGVGAVQISQPGQSYELGDIITLAAGFPAQSDTLAQVQVVAVGAVQVQIDQGGQNYQVGDLLFYKTGAGTQTLQLKVTQVVNQVNRGVIQSVQIVQPGYYTSVSTQNDNWFTTGAGTGALILPVWGVSDLFVLSRGIYLNMSMTGTQQSVTNNQLGPSAGSGIQVTLAPSHVTQQVTLAGDGILNYVNLHDVQESVSLLTTLNGQIVDNPVQSLTESEKWVLNFVPQVGDVVQVVVFNSSLFSLRGTETVTIQPAQLTYDLQNPPRYQPAQSLNSQVSVNGQLLRSPHYVRYQGDGVQTTFNLHVMITQLSYVKVWQNLQLVPSFLYTLAPSMNQIVFLEAPGVGVNILMEIADPSISMYDYVINGEQIEFVSGTVSVGDQVQVISFVEDSSQNWNLDTFAGVTPSVYTLRRMPTDFSQVQVYVDGALQSAMWDYTLKIVGTSVIIQFASITNHANTQVIECRYQTGIIAKPPVAFRLFENVFGDKKSFRLSDKHRTILLQDVLWNSEEIYVQDGTNLAPASVNAPGAVWINSERIEYTQISAVPDSQNPYRHKLQGLRRGTWGTSAGVQSDLTVSYENGDGVSQLFLAPYGTQTRVKVNNQEQIVNINFTLEVNPTGVVPGTYVKFKSDHVPAVGSQNIQFFEIINSVQVSMISHAAGSVVRDASANAEIPAGYQWPHGDQGIQRGLQPQTEFLLAAPGVRT